MSTSSAVYSKCSKPKGEYCRLHNPVPVSQKFQSVNDVFSKLDRESSKRTVPAPSPKPGISFQKISETRKLASNVPAKIEEHVQLSKLAIDKRNLSREEQIALTGYTGFAAGACNGVLLGEEYDYYDNAPVWKESEAPCDFSSREELVSYMETIDSVLSTREDKQRVVYRGIPIYESLHDEIGASIGKDLHISDTAGLVQGLEEYYKVGKTFNFSTYLSTSHSSYYAADRTDESYGTKKSYYDADPEIKGIMFEMKTNAGLDVTGLAKNRNSHEREVILPRDTHFKVTGVYVKPSAYNTVSGYDDSRRPEELHEGSFNNLAVVVQMVEVDSLGNEITHTNPHVPTTSIEDIVSA